jgi:hypothetical protein
MILRGLALMKAHLAGFELKKKKNFPRRSKDKQNKAQKN